MTERIGAVGGPERIDRREGERRERERRADQERSRALVPVEPAESEFKPETAPARPAVHVAADPGAAAFVAQQMGQRGQKRGLRGGPPVLGAARAAYMGAEYSGEAERRPPLGRAAKTDI
ncbi:hypothetical protein [Brevundimonas mediterranea]|uniref:Uncharacterized protein n=1 Tax=Brevundimonas mediterranea TaxID=74329 RepID=A0A7Z9C3Z0_9CAUL|nr:hypothetical protein [Brevundimonas mediterranea]OGN47273.1 MAG: hypothetical protein A2795_13345 [Caulobacterales bacterium RIFCSPHIGHO2_01_FULL_67_30]VDC48706.1 hypothetical protein BREV_BREV_03242 [Brevundimonas mediterranea]